ncbi:S8 family peptidase [Bradyrhizobium japonicum]|uniref:S8 family peptidase n=1 Tax=Bradyrhizobium japonicum TaxID=375 RepID=UPI002714EA06|nr:S8 family peptidase [Bradyrhizobium japonicum]WLB53716.1 S8 family peptidase [Bradyrhizobium japonicum]WLB64411.1 S8 family peptidase [Bradyrhizobium japonicum]
MVRKKPASETQASEGKADAGDVGRVLTKTSIAPDLLAVMDGGAKRKIAAKAAAAEPTFKVIIEFNRSFSGGIGGARLVLLWAYSKARGLADPSVQMKLVPALAPAAARFDASLIAMFDPADNIDIEKSMWTDNYVFAMLTSKTIGKLSDCKPAVISSPQSSPVAAKPIALIYKIWRDHEIKRCVYESVRTIKCDAAFNTFQASGKGIVWAVADTGIDATHPHFRSLETTKLPDGLLHKDFTEQYPDSDASQAAALTDRDGHGTHVAGIIAGLTCRTQDNLPGIETAIIKISVKAEVRDSKGNVTTVPTEHKQPIAGLARDCKLVSLKVLTDGQSGDLSNLLAALGYIQRCNDNGRSLKIHGVNLSLGYPFDPEWFAAGQSPLCVEVDRLVHSGVCVVVAAGNGGYGVVSGYYGAAERAAHMGTIADPGNASLAITVGSTHRDMPHTFGVSFFSAKGPTSDGRMKPDLVAPGERIVSCALMNNAAATEALFREDSGTSMAAPHVSGAIAAFLSVRNEFLGHPEEVKEIFVAAATNIKRRPEFQGAGLLDLLRALQSV